MVRKLGYLVCNIKTHYVPELLFEIPKDEERFQWFSWVNENTWRYCEPNSSNFEFEIGDDVYSNSCPILGIYNLEDNIHLQKMVLRSHHQESAWEDLHQYE